MKSRTLAMLATLAVASPAAAEPHKLLVLQSEGRVDAATRAKIDAAIVKLASASEPQTAAGELNFSDAATAVGCKPDTASCKDEVLGMLSVDEIVITTVTPKPGGLEVAVRRFAKGGASHDATVTLPTGTPPDKLDGIAPLFGGAAPAPATGGGAISTGPTTSPTGEPPVIPAPNTVPAPAPSPVVQPLPAPPPGQPPPGSHHRLEVAGMWGGGGLLVLGVILWGAASGVQSDINNAPVATKQNLMDLKDLESKGDADAGLGNVFVITGLVVGGVATYFYIRDRRAASTATARLTPAVFDHGAGLVFTIGGTP
ncbi:MAG TPA: hypothetical protein VH165_31315 [Kofleriaceae bacterium]|nr:hypothetical protein [Kofleriaceae bacterium]